MKNHLSPEILERYGHSQQLAGQAAASITEEAAMLHVANGDGASQKMEVPPKEGETSQTTDVYQREDGVSQTTAEVHPTERVAVPKMPLESDVPQMNDGAKVVGN